MSVMFIGVGSFGHEGHMPLFVLLKPLRAPPQFQNELILILYTIAPRVKKPSRPLWFWYSCCINKYLNQAQEIYFYHSLE